MRKNLFFFYKLFRKKKIANRVLCQTTAHHPAAVPKSCRDRTAVVQCCGRYNENSVRWCAYYDSSAAVIGDCRFWYLVADRPSTSGDGSDSADDEPPPPGGDRTGL